MSEAQRFPRPFRILAYSVFAVSVCVFAWSFKVSPPELSPELVLLAVATMLSENYALYLDRYHISLTFPLTIAAIVLAGPTAAAIVAGLSAITLMDIKTRTALSAMLFNLGELVLVTLVAGWSYWWLLARFENTAELVGGGFIKAVHFPQVLVALSAVALICTLGNVLIMALGLSTIRGQSMRTSVTNLAWLVPSQLALAFVGFLIAQVLAISVVAFPLFIAPLLVARQLYQRYAELKSAYADTVRSLIGALEAKDPYTRGHSERVAGYALKLGTAVGLDQRTLERLEYAALLHDLGKLAVPSAVLTKPGALTDEEMDSIRLHPTRGADMVAKIPPLRDLAEFVGCHHEWYGGGGYPLGIEAAAIPQLALILCVADSYDAMTTTRAYRSALSHEQALDELVRGAGRQFDPNLVRAFEEGRVGEHTPDEEFAGVLQRPQMPSVADGGGL